MKRIALATCLILAPLSFAATAQSPQPAARFEQTLSPRAITAVQKQLRQQGYYHGRVDGVWGRGTQAALARFQEQNRLEVTAQLNPATAKALGLGPDVVLGNTVDVAGAAHAQTLSPRAVATVQQRLRQQGFYRGRADGRWGRGTEAALSRFQEARGLQVTGQLNPETARALRLGREAGPGYAESAPPPRAQPLSRGVVRVVQEKLRQGGFYAGRPDGTWGRRTAEAVAGFQTSRGLPATGELNPQTVSALGLDPNNLSASAAYPRR